MQVEPLEVLLENKDRIVFAGAGFKPNEEVSVYIKTMDALIYNPNRVIKIRKFYVKSLKQGLKLK